MTILANDKRQVNLYYNSKDDLGRKIRVHAEASGLKVSARDVLAANLTGTEWTELAEMLGVKVNELIEQEHPVFKELYGDKHVDIDENGAISILKKHPEVLVFPIGVRGDRAVMVKQTNQLDALFDPDSGGVPQP